jgi:hypothetical protein
LLAATLTFHEWFKYYVPIYSPSLKILRSESSNLSSQQELRSNPTTRYKKKRQPQDNEAKPLSIRIEYLRWRYTSGWEEAKTITRGRSGFLQTTEVRSGPLNKVEFQQPIEVFERTKKSFDSKPDLDSKKKKKADNFTKVLEFQSRNREIRSSFAKDSIPHL